MSNYNYKSSNEKEIVICSVEYCDEIEDENGRIFRGVRVTCTKCNHSTESFGQSKRSVKRCLALLCEECPNNEENWYEV